MMHDMGHGAGMSMQDMVRDMRNRFFVALIFAIPVFLYSPMGKMFGDFATPFGIDRKLILFLTGTAAIIYPAWPFFVAAWRAARNGAAIERCPHCGELLRTRWQVGNKARAAIKAWLDEAAP